MVYIGSNPIGGIISKEIGKMETNIILHGDCKDRLSEIPTGSVDLIYLDPPFFTNKKYEERMQDTSEAMKASFEDRWAGGVDHFIKWIRPALSECHRVLKDTGSIYLHCDWHADSELDIEMKRIFVEGGGNFLNKIVWHYGGFGRGGKIFLRKHDTILLYSKGKEHLFNEQREEYGKVSKEREGKKAYTGMPDGKGGYVGKGEVMKLHPGGKLMDDVWYIPNINPMAKERLGYPTQKPEKLLERIIKTSSNEGDIILDPFMGSGTTLAVAAKLNRNFIGIDISERACQIAKTRLGGIKVLEGQDIRVLYKNESIGYLKDMYKEEFEKWACERCGGRHLGGVRDRDGELPDGTPIEVKTFRESEKIGRAVVQKLVGVAHKSGMKKGILVGWDFSKEAIIETDKQEKQGIEIELCKVEYLRIK